MTSTSSREEVISLRISSAAVEPRLVVGWQAGPDWKLTRGLAIWLTPYSSSSLVIMCCMPGYVLHA
jgi:hypothetical protein